MTRSIAVNEEEVTAKSAENAKETLINGNSSCD